MSYAPPSDDRHRQDRIKQLKKVLVKEYRIMQVARPDSDCGHEIAKYMCQTYANACAAINVTLDALAAIDPTTPKTRF